MNPEIEKFTKQKETFISELTEIQNRAQSLTTDINRLDGIILYLSQDKGGEQAQDEVEIESIGELPPE